MARKQMDHLSDIVFEQLCGLEECLKSMDYFVNPEEFPEVSGLLFALNRLHDDARQKIRDLFSKVREHSGRIFISRDDRGNVESVMIEKPENCPWGPAEEELSALFGKKKPGQTVAAA